MKTAAEFMDHVAVCSDCSTPLRGRLAASREGPETSDVHPVADARPGAAPRTDAVTGIAVVNGIIGAIYVASGLAVAAMVAGMGGLPHGLGTGQGGGALLFVAVVVAAVLGVALAVLHLLAAYGVWERRKWGRMLSIVLGVLAAVSALRLVMLDGTALLHAAYAAYTLFVLCKPGYAAEFS
jgi:hypothetical protein